MEYVKCIENNFTGVHDPEFTVGKLYEMDSEGCIVDDDECCWCLDDNYCYAGKPHMAKFEIVEEESVTTAEETCSQHCDKPMSPQRTMESMRRSAIEDLQTQCSRANLSISIDPEGFNIFDCDTDMQTMVHSVADAVEILETKLEYKDSMGKWGWL